MKAIDVKAVEDYKIKVTFDDGVFGTVDLGDLVQKGIFQELKQGSSFKTLAPMATALPGLKSWKLMLLIFMLRFRISDPNPVILSCGIPR